MQSENKFISGLINFLTPLMPLIMVVIGALVIYYFYNKELFEQLGRLLFPLLLYGIALSFVYLMKQKKQKKLIEDNGSPEVTITVNYFYFFWHDLLIFGTPSLMLIGTYWYRGQVTYWDIVLSAIALVGLYSSSIIYKSRINKY